MVFAYSSRKTFSDIEHGIDTDRAVLAAPRWRKLHGEPVGIDLLDFVEINTLQLHDTLFISPWRPSRKSPNRASNITVALQVKTPVDWFKTVCFQLPSVLNSILVPGPRQVSHHAQLHLPKKLSKLHQFLHRSQYWRNLQFRQQTSWYGLIRHYKPHCFLRRVYICRSNNLGQPSWSPTAGTVSPICLVSSALTVPSILPLVSSPFMVVVVSASAARQNSTAPSSTASPISYRS